MWTYYLLRTYFGTRMTQSSMRPALLAPRRSRGGRRKAPETPLVHYGMT